jgi:hypothetical protein
MATDSAAIVELYLHLMATSAHSHIGTAAAAHPIPAEFRGIQTKIPAFSDLDDLFLDSGQSQL